ncbi:MAG: hypothetical protein M0R46_10525 [Candidatus Muirbacterium halophilum]|nr:hypothetical protein [Candidatus Muirbacterium halophilum]
MKIRVIDFDILTKNYIPYVSGYKDIEKEKEKLLNSIEPIRIEMESIIKKSQNEEIKNEEIERYRSMQEDLIVKDKEFKKILKDMYDDLNLKVFEELQVIITEWSIENDIDMVTGKMEVIYNKESVESTNDILEILKRKNLYQL